MSRYLPSSPLQKDTDSDGRTDSEESDNYNILNKFETEEYSSASQGISYIYPEENGKEIIKRENVVRHQFNVNLTADSLTSASWARQTFILETSGYHEIYLEGYGEVGFIPYGPTMSPIAKNDAQMIEFENEILQNAIELNIYRILGSDKTSGKIEPEKEIRDSRYSVSHIQDRTDEPQTSILKYWTLTQDYDISGGSYILEIKLNTIMFNRIFCLNPENPTNPLLYKLSLISINNNEIDILKVSTTYLSSDSDGDGLTDHIEVEKGSPIISADIDEDGLSDILELKDGTNPMKRDSDFDGISDRIELGYGSIDSDTYTTYDEMPRNWDENIYVVTDPLNSDTDKDGIPDGVIDGWGLKEDENFESNGMYGVVDITMIGKRITGKVKTSMEMEPPILASVGLVSVVPVHLKQVAIIWIVMEIVCRMDGNHGL